jgi:hypothetical protein
MAVMKGTVVHDSIFGNTGRIVRAMTLCPAGESVAEQRLDEKIAERVQAIVVAVYASRPGKRLTADGPGFRS